MGWATYILDDFFTNSSGRPAYGSLVVHATFLNGKKHLIRSKSCYYITKKWQTNFVQQRKKHCTTIPATQFHM
jgi:hypothetical protein